MNQERRNADSKLTKDEKKDENGEEDESSEKVDEVNGEEKHSTVEVENEVKDQVEEKSSGMLGDVLLLQK